MIMNSSPLNQQSCPDFGFQPPETARETFASNRFYQTVHNRFDHFFFSFENEVRFTFELLDFFQLIAIAILHFPKIHHFDHLGPPRFNPSFYLQILTFDL